MLPSSHVPSSATFTQRSVLGASGCPGCQWVNVTGLPLTQTQVLTSASLLSPIHGRVVPAKVTRTRPLLHSPHKRGSRHLPHRWPGPRRRQSPRQSGGTSVLRTRPHRPGERQRRLAPLRRPSLRRPFPRSPRSHQRRLLLRRRHPSRRLPPRRCRPPLHRRGRRPSRYRRRFTRSHRRAATRRRARACGGGRAGTRGPGATTHAVARTRRRHALGVVRSPAPGHESPRGLATSCWGLGCRLRGTCFDSCGDVSLVCRVRCTANAGGPRFSVGAWGVGVGGKAARNRGPTAFEPRMSLWRGGDPRRRGGGRCVGPPARALVVARVRVPRDTPIGAS